MKYYKTMPKDFGAATWEIMLQQDTNQGRFYCRRHQDVIVPNYINGESFESFLSHSPKTAAWWAMQKKKAWKEIVGKSQENKPGPGKDEPEPQMEEFEPFED